jgi:hypothetical protein
MLPPSATAQAPNKIGGMFLVDGHPVAKGSRNLVWLQPGTHKIKFMCPGWGFVDGLPEIQFDFSLGKRYKFECIGRDVSAVAIEPIEGA